MKTVVITGISGVLGSALGKYYLKEGWKVVGVTRRSNLEGDWFSEICVNNQANAEDAGKLLAYDPDLIIVNSGQIETQIGKMGEPLLEQFESITRINYIFPAIVGIEASQHKLNHPLDIIAIGSIADGSPSCFGPIYHASKIALHYYVSGVGPIIHHANPNIKLRLYRPGAIKGPLAWAPVNRLNLKGYEIRAKRVNSAPDGDIVAEHIAKWIESGEWVGAYDEPFSFKIFKYLFALAPNLFYKLQLMGWKKGSRYFGAPAPDFDINKVKRRTI